MMCVWPGPVGKRTVRFGVFIRREHTAKAAAQSWWTIRTLFFKWFVHWLNAILCVVAFYESFLFFIVCLPLLHRIRRSARRDDDDVCDGMLIEVVLVCSESKYLSSLSECWTLSALTTETEAKKEILLLSLLHILFLVLSKCWSVLGARDSEPNSTSRYTWLSWVVAVRPVDVASFPLFTFGRTM